MLKGRKCGYTAGGSEAINSNKAIVKILRDAAGRQGLMKTQ